MEASRFGIGGSSQGLSSRRNAILVAVLSAVLAAALIYLFVSHYKKNAAPQVITPPASTVWVTTRAIPAGTPEADIALQGYFKAEQTTSVLQVRSPTRRRSSVMSRRRPSPRVSRSRLGSSPRRRQSLVRLRPPVASISRPPSRRPSEQSPSRSTTNTGSPAGSPSVTPST